MFSTVIIVIIIYCMIKLFVRLSGWLLAILIVAALLDPVGARGFFHEVFYWIGQVWERLLYVLGF